ncbi:hypothetical protein ACTMTI_49500 [Nonomuraea sp. H19]|uniref:hypothetical protein n=1 Tax=Nonomuraea sp. H19 TaxID=3452206 RepID=UPI003F89BD78
MDQHTGWLEVGEEATYAPHTVQRFTSPESKLIHTLGSGLITFFRWRARLRHTS